MSNPVLLIAVQEFTLNRRNKWVTAFAGIFALLTFFIAYFGMVTSGYSGFQDFVRTSTSLISLTGFIMPLFALLLGVFSFISNKEYLEMMVAQPVSRQQVVLGKFLGLLLTLLGATAIGFSVPGVIISLSIGVGGALSYALFLAYAMILGVIFSSCAVLISQVAGRQQVALGAAIGVWLFFEVVYGVLVLATTLYFSPAVLKVLLIALLAGNPVDLFRVLSLLAAGGAEFFGPAGATLIKLVGAEAWTVAAGLAGLLAWAVVPLLVSLKLFSRQNL